MLIRLHILAIACEVLARRITHHAPADRLSNIMSTRYQHRQSDGDIELSSALELAIDTHWYVYSVGTDEIASPVTEGYDMCL